MAKSKSDVFKDAVAAGAVPSDANEDDYTVDELSQRIRGDEVVDRRMVMEPIVAPDGHVVLSKEDIRARQA